MRVELESINYRLLYENRSSRVCMKVQFGKIVGFFFFNVPLITTANKSWHNTYLQVIYAVLK